MKIIKTGNIIKKKIFTRCNTCKKLKNRRQFINNKNIKLKTCLECRDKRKIYVNNNKERIKQLTYESNDRNIEKRREYRSGYQCVNFDRIKDRNLKYKEENLEKVLDQGRERSRIYYMNNREKRLCISCNLKMMSYTPYCYEFKICKGCCNHGCY